MSIVAQINVESRRFSGWLDPRYPIGYWQAALSLVGNASGGLLSIDLVFQQANGAARINSQMYSVERIAATHTGGISRFVEISALNMGGPANLGFTHSYTIRLEIITGVAGRTAMLARDMAMLPLFLGSQRNAGTTASLSLIGDNDDTETYRFEAEGYRWSPRSVLIDGGPQRPPTGLYAR